MLSVNISEDVKKKTPKNSEKKKLLLIRNHLVHDISLNQLRSTITSTAEGFAGPKKLHRAPDGEDTHPLDSPGPGGEGPRTSAPIVWRIA